jgi:hypothetical protein
MLRLFSPRSGAAVRTVVHAAVGAPLVRAAAFPAAVDPPPGPAFGEALYAQVDGDPPEGVFVDGATAARAPRDVFVVPGGLGLAALAFVNRLRDDRLVVETWTLTADTPPCFGERRACEFGPGEVAVIEAVALPRLRNLVVLSHPGATPAVTLHLHDLERNRLRSIGPVEGDPFRAPETFVAALPVAPDAILALHRTGRVDLGDWGHVALANHLVLYAPQQPDGVEILTLGLDDGNVSHWGMVGSTLWLQAVDGRLDPAPESFTWSLDLGALL